MKKMTHYLYRSCLLLGLLFPGMSTAEDTEIYFSKELTTVNHNVLFLLDMSASMGEIVVGSGDPDEVVVATVDDSDSGFSKSANGWFNWFYADKYGTSVNVTVNSISDAWWEAPLENGTYQVYAWWSSVPTGILSSATNVQYNLYDNGTDKLVVHKNQRATTGQWNLLGSVEITSGIGKVRLKATSSGYDGTSLNLVVADAIKWEKQGSNDKTRLKIMQTALKSVLDTAPDQLNVGFANYGAVTGWDSNKGHGIKFPIKPIDDEARPIIEESLPLDGSGTPRWNRSAIPDPDAGMSVRNYLSVLAGAWEPDGVTPIVDALYEAALYFRGETVYWGHNEGVKYGSGPWTYANSRIRSAHPSSYEGEPYAPDYTQCKRVSRPRVKTADFAAWLAARTWLRCPADRNNLSSTETGHFDNCEATRHDCYDRNICDGSWVGGTCTGGYDEAGYCKAWTGATCSGEIITEEYCRYAYCATEMEPEPSNYITPITEVCQSNFIVMLSDGRPEYTASYDNTVSGGDTDGISRPGYVLAVNRLNVNYGIGAEFDVNDCESNPAGYISGRCGPELTHFLSLNDNNITLPGDQTVDTYVIGFDLGADESAQDYLRKLVTTDNLTTNDVVEGYFSAGDEEQLITAFGDILKTIGATTTAFASPGYSVSIKSGLAHEDSIYVPVFDKRVTPRWSGNLKKFKLRNAIEGTGEGARSVRKIQGKSSVNGDADTDAVTELGAFTDEAWDLWSTSARADGGSVTDGGVASLLNPDNRHLYSDLDCAGSSACDLTNAANVIDITNVGNGGNITKQLLGITGDNTDLNKKLICFIRGYSKYYKNAVPPSCGGTNRKHMGDMLHSDPVIITYDKDYENAGVSKKQIIFAATNEGYLHAFDTKTGEELFAFMPKDLLKNIGYQYLNNDVGTHRSGVDGIITAWVNDADEDGVIEGADGEHVYLYFGLRRGGNAYYALDVTNPLAPKLLWKIDNADTGFSNLAQSWSAAYRGKIYAGDVKKEVLIFSGGYDVNQDNRIFTGEGARLNTDTIGNDVFIVDATTGAYIWSIQGGTSGSAGITGHSALTHSIPGGVRALDMNRDGVIDRLYFADVAGNVWKVELDRDNFDEDESVNSLQDAKLIKFASLGGSDPETDKRKFYNEPDVSIFRESEKRYLMISIGSGYRSDPIGDEINDYFYVLLDTHPFTPLPDGSDDGIPAFSTITSSDLALISVTINEDEDGNEVPTISSSLSDQTVLQANKRGWYLDLPKNGEKVLASSATSHGKVLFTTLIPESYIEHEAGPDICSSVVTQGRFYALDIQTAKPTADLNGSGGLPDNKDLYTVITANEIPGSPQLIFNSPGAEDGSDCTESNCVQNVDVRTGKKLTQVLSYNAGVLESVFWGKQQDKE